MRKRTPPRRTAKKALPLNHEPLELTIEALSHEGRGIARVDGKTLFVAGALPGEQITARITQRHKRFDEAECIAIHTPSADRADPVCAHYGSCGGCDLQHLSHPRQIETKQQLVLDQLMRLGGVAPDTIETPLHSAPTGYRRSTRIGINRLQRDGSLIVGFRRRGSHKLTPISHCPVLTPPLSDVIGLLNNVLAGADDVRIITHAEATQGDHEGALTLRITRRPPPQLLQQLSDALAALQMKLYLDDGSGAIPFSAESELSYQLDTPPLTLSYRPGDFIQVNAEINRQMIERALAWLELSPASRVLDLFCGIGNFTLPLAQAASEVVGVEGSEEMVARATENAHANGLQNCSFYRADLSTDLRHQRWFNQGFDAIVLDPPRTGALEVIRQTAHYKARKILYVSCNPSALARDAAELVSQGYTLSRFCVMDMFPNTSHVESLALFERTGR